MDLLQKPQWDPITPTLLGGFTPIIPFLGLNINENSSIIGYIFHHSPYPIGSMYGIYANIGCILMVNVTIYTIHGSYGKWHVECGEKPSNHWHQLCGVTTTSLIWSLMKEPLEDHHHFVVADFMPCIWIIHCKRAPYENISCDIPTPIEGEGGEG